MGDIGQSPAQSVLHGLAVEKEGFDAVPPQRLDFVGRARGAGNAHAVAGEGLGDRRAGIAAAKNHHMHQLTPASRHSVSTSSSVSSARCVAKPENSPASISRDSAHTAIPRTTGEASAASCRHWAISAFSPELPAAISTLRIKRSRPIRFTGEPLKKARKAASSSVSRKAIDGSCRSSRAFSFISEAAFANLFQGQAARQSSQP
ncbi:hypothetical protein RHECNPAF_2530072 [Rhizobium etli CNPAF512]|nr:hypothetical protein RHECNPAF_2530072 [Rhizobium etli CNPAF512]